MNHLTMKTLYALILILLTGTAYGQSNLPACPALDNSQAGIKRTKNWNNCFGMFVVGDGNVYEGEYQNGVPNGNGSAKFPNGDKYVGEFKDGVRSGIGTDEHFNGSKYVGEQKNNKRHGQGTYFMADGRISLGEWKEGQPHGRFIEYRADKTLDRSGIFKDGQLVTPQYIDPNSFTRIARNNTVPAVSDSQRQEIVQRERQIELEVQMVAENRRKLEEDKRQRELAKQSNSISITASSTQPDSSGVVTINIQTNTDTSSLKINGEELGGKPDGSYSVKRVARVGQETKFTIAGVDVNGNTDIKTITVIRQTVDSKCPTSSCVRQIGVLD